MGASSATQMPQTVPRSGRSPPSRSVDERAVPASPTDLQHLLRLLGAASPPDHMLHSPLTSNKPPPPYVEPNHTHQPSQQITDTQFLERFYDFEYGSYYPTPSPSSDEGSVPTLSVQQCSPYSSPDYPAIVKEEPNRFLAPDYGSPYPLSPAGSCVSYPSGASPHAATSPAHYHDEYIDIEALLKENQIIQENAAENTFLTPKVEVEDRPRDHELLRSVLEDTSFQKRLNIKPLPLLELSAAVKMEETNGGGTEGEPTLSHHIDQVLSLAIEQSRKDVDATCNVLGISPDPMQWSCGDVKSWVMFTLQQYSLPVVPAEYFAMDGANLVTLTEEDFNQRAPQSGSTLYAQLEIWKAARHEAWRWTEQTQHTSDHPTVLPTPGDISDDEDSESTSTTAASSATSNKSPVKTGGAHIHLWQFLKELLASPQIHGSAIRWIDRSNGVFKIEDSVRVARLWGKRKNRPAMNYDKLSRSIRQYYKKGIMKKTERSQRLVYQFCHPYCL